MGIRTNFDLATLDGIQGFRFRGVAANLQMGRSVSSAGDVNGDGVEDLIFGEDQDGAGNGRAYIIFGSASDFGAAEFDLSTLTGSNGLRINGVTYNSRLGFAVSSAGDVNADGIGDVLIGAYHAPHRGNGYVLFGKTSGFQSVLTANDLLDGINGFGISGTQDYDQLGFGVALAGDINGDGLDDIMISARYDDNTDQDSGTVYVIFGSASGFGNNVDINTLNGANGFRVHGYGSGAQYGNSLSTAGDLNGDGLDDIICTAQAERGFVLYGSATGFDADIYVQSLDGTTGFELLSATSASSVGDVNGDGRDDILVANTRYTEGSFVGGGAFVIYGIGTPQVPECGNNVLVAGEECDDGNTISGDGCSATCTNECPAGTTINAAGDACECDAAGASLNSTSDVCECDAAGASLNTVINECECDAAGASINAASNTCECDVAGALFNAAGDACESTCSDGSLNQDETGVDCGGSTCDPCPSATFTPFGAAMTAPLLGACPTSESNPVTEAAWAAPEWGRCWSSTITATRSTGMIDTNNDWAATLSLTDGLGTNYYVTAGGATTTWTIYWREQDLTPTNGGYSQDITITVTETIAAASSSATDEESQVFTVTLARDLFGSVSSATDAGVEELVSFANARMHRVEGAVSAVYYAALTFIASGGTIDVDITAVTAKGTAATWPKLAAASMTSYNPCSLSGAVNIAGNPYPSDALDADCAPSLDLCSTDTTTASRVDVYIPLDLGTTFDTASHSVTLVMVVKDAQSNDFQEFYISISPSNGFVTWCDSNLAGVGAPDPKDVLSVDFHVGLSDSPATTVTDGERAELASGSAFSRTGSIIALTASAKGGHAIRLEDVKVFWDFVGDGSVTPDYGVLYSATDGAGQLTAQHSGACSSELVCKEVAATASGQESLFHTYATDLAAKDFIQPSPRTSEVDTLLEAYLSRITVPSEGTLHNTYLVNPTVELSSPVATVYVFALFKIVQQDGSTRRMLLQQAGPTSRGSDGAASAAVRFDVTPAAFAAYTLDISPELVTSWNLQLQTSDADACLPSEQLVQNVRTRLLVHLSSAATALRDVQIVSLTVNKAGVSCSASRPQRRRKLLAPAVAGPFVTVEALFIFDDAEAAKPAVDVAKLQAASGVLSVLQTQSSSAISAVDIIGAASPQAPAPLPSSSDSSSPSALHLTLAAAAGATLVVAVLGVVAWVRRKSARRSLTEVQAVALNLTSQTVNMDKIQIECGQRAPPINDAAIRAVATTTVKLTPGPMETLASLSEPRPGASPVLPRADSQKHLLQSN